MTLPSDRPVIAEPEERPYKALPALGQMRDAFRLRLLEKRCQGCGIKFTTDQSAARYCTACAATVCIRCSRRGGFHTPSCTLANAIPRDCQACGRSIIGTPKGTRFCEDCAAIVCTDCGRKAGYHTPRCGTRVVKVCARCRAELTSEDRYRRFLLCAACRPCTVTAEDVLAIYEATWRRAVRYARRRVGADAEDVVQEVALYWYDHRDALSAVSPKLFIMAVRQRAAILQQSGWRKYSFPVDLEGLDILQAKHFQVANGRPRAELFKADVRLPGEVAG